MSYYVDENGRNNFGAEDAGRYGKNLEVGQEVETEYGLKTIVKIYNYIQTGPSGTSNYVAVDLGD